MVTRDGHNVFMTGTDMSITAAYGLTGQHLQGAAKKVAP